MEKGFKIKKITAFVAVDENGTEGVMGAQMGNTSMPLVCADDIRVAKMFPIAEAIKHATGKDYKILQFNSFIDVTKQTRELFKNQML
jgi:hypothetical protein